MLDGSMEEAVASFDRVGTSLFEAHSEINVLIDLEKYILI